MTPLFTDREGKFITVDVAPGGHEWTFYRKPNLKMRGQRIKPRHIRHFYSTEAEAIETLKSYGNTCRKDWKILPGKE